MKRGGQCMLLPNELWGIVFECCLDINLESYRVCVTVSLE